MVMAALAFALMVWCVKVARAELSAVEIIAWRTPAGLALAWVFLGRGRGSAAAFHVHNRRIMVLRCALGFGAMVSFFTAAKALSVADITLITRIQPIVVGMLAPLALGASERSSGRTWSLLLAGLAGCAILVGPDLSGGGTAGLWALLAVAFSSCAHVTLRALGATDRPGVIVFWFQLTVGVMAVIVMAAWHGSIHLPPAHLWPYLCGAGALATLAQWLMTRAYALERASIVSGASHVGPVWAIGVDLACFGVWPSATTLLGGGVVMAAVLALLVREVRDNGAKATG
jgi:drug/metabolite transporter (DMT)-like permease